MFVQKPLPWSEDAFEPVISAKTIYHHYHKHHAGYVKKLNDALHGEKLSIQDALFRYEHKPSVWNNAAQHYNHEFFWESLTPKPTKPQGILAQFDSKAFLTACTGLFGSGWVWLVYDDTSECLHIESTTNANMPHHKPLLVMDVWEHSYYLDYQQDRAVYVEKVMQFFDWDRAKQRLETENELFTTKPVSMSDLYDI